MPFIKVYIKNVHPSFLITRFLKLATYIAVLYVIYELWHSFDLTYQSGIFTILYVVLFLLSFPYLNDIWGLNCSTCVFTIIIFSQSKLPLYLDKL